MRILVSIAVLLHALVPSQASADRGVRDPFEFFQPSISLSSRDRAALDRGNPLVSLPEARDRELVVFSAVALPAEVTGDRAVAWFRDVVSLRKSSYVVAMGVFSRPARIEDLAGLTLDDDDLKDIRGCRAGDCGLKLTAREIAALQRVIREAGGNWRAAVQTAFRAMVLRRVQAFLSDGHRGLGQYSDRRQPRAPAEVFRALLERSVFLREHAPALAHHLAGPCRHPARGRDEYIYWSKERWSGKTVITATYVKLIPGDGVSAPEVLMAGKQIFATHYLDGSFGITALVRDPGTSRPYLVNLNRSEVDLLDGFWGGLVRRMVESRVRDAAPAIISEVGRRLAGGDPPDPGNRTGR